MAVGAIAMSTSERWIHGFGSATRSSVFSAPEEMTTSGTSSAEAIARTADWAYEAHLTIKGFLALQEGWDSYGAPIISDRAIEAALLFVDKIADLPKPFVAPTSEGGVVVEWHRKSSDIALEFGAAGGLEVTYHLPNGSAWSGRMVDIPIDDSVMADLLFGDDPQ